MKVLYVFVIKSRQSAITWNSALNIFLSHNAEQEMGTFWKLQMQLKIKSDSRGLSWYSTCTVRLHAACFALSLTTVQLDWANVVPYLENVPPVCCSLLVSFSYCYMRVGKKLWLEGLRAWDHWEDLDVDRIVARWILGNQGVTWINLAQVRDLWWALVNSVINLRFP
jgi:hypothetical protein